VIKMVTSKPNTETEALKAGLYLCEAHRLGEFHEARPRPSEPHEGGSLGLRRGWREARFKPSSSGQGTMPASRLQTVFSVTQSSHSKPKARSKASID
jgi:hypothetical protein